MKIVLLIIAGIFGGVLGGMGMGGGTLLIPLLTLFCDIEQHTAQAFNLVAFIPMAVVALILHSKNKLLDLTGILYLIIPATLCSVLTSLLIKNIDKKLLARSFGIFLIALGAYQMFEAVKKIISKSKKQKETKEDLIS